jgi:hypothetical protein
MLGDGDPHSHETDETSSATIVTRLQHALRANPKRRGAIVVEASSKEPTAAEIMPHSEAVKMRPVLS